MANMPCRFFSETDTTVPLTSPSGLYLTESAISASLNTQWHGSIMSVKGSNSNKEKFNLMLNHNY